VIKIAFHEKSKRNFGGIFIEQIIYRQLTLCVAQFAGGPLLILRPSS